MPYLEVPDDKLRVGTTSGDGGAVGLLTGVDGNSSDGVLVDGGQGGV